ncbi:hypothetical protein VX159_03775 [Dechloromonas sp. ZY10]|uniref:hypothetical protein n=1 Tax=Dechloromonas aquae TaxID=2664436 RepID=UPI0035284291
MRRWPLLLLLALSAGVSAEEWVPVCHGYGCVAQDEVVFSSLRLRLLAGRLAQARDAAGEREILAAVVGDLYRWAGEQSEIRNDRGGNFADGSMPGRMDCLDHSTTTTRFLQLLMRRGALRYHRVLPPVSRAWLGLVENHWAAQIEVLAAVGGEERYVVDSWFVDNGEPAVILPLEEWKKGAGPDV